MTVALEDVSVRMARRDVLEGLSWQLPSKGKTLLLGRNGAGKSTTLRVASGLQAPREGRVCVDGGPVSQKQLKARVAMMPQDICALDGLTVREQVAFASWLGGSSEREARKLADEALKAADLVSLADRSPSALSGGELRRVGLAEVLARPADVLLLDEPTAGLDPAQRVRVRDLILRIDRPVVVSTHQLDDVDVIFEEVAVIDGGKLVFQGDIDEFIARGEGNSPYRRVESAFLALTGDV
ncbi:ATP-binding cassette domain-containing protein [Yimella sp. RIT 621]|uniref:ABC transporter ATP-binding protein n=1 Tax=Yimella sp. RIT 621 TaxID=2510323 RepID=UPI00101BAD9E|nr:ATP-binding cassette domain-containing protein [Yimella sp. RIT 621]RYG78804.1 ATP-binding cassette domain-containing protein [Yimella sp. RIT 621]